MTTGARQVAVLIAAHNAAATLERAIRSALAEAETSEVIVVDDASSDTTRQLAEAEGARDPRVRVIGLDNNVGPGEARNIALGSATALYVAILDSDDMFLPGRLGALLKAAEWDLVADNIAFVTAEQRDRMASRPPPTGAERFRPLTPEAFVRGNLRQRNTARGELGFLKPLMSRDFLSRHGLRYDPALRLGEDYDLYTRALLAGARMKVTSRPGYLSVVRNQSLSARHTGHDLAQLHDAIERHLASGPMAPDLRRAMLQHLAEVRMKRDHRRFLDLKREQGPRSALGYALADPRRPWPLARDILRDKLGPDRGSALGKDGVRLLLPGGDT
ncbi:glycosyltransferase family 2 protein [Pseudoroseicyclus tamaricis]|uniref:Glycosyltransferase n=1 Tax=Pseudoroseicyclus tamaricis TaxID=2705421 RepID=A0A6B2JXK4_9RHOB|nr:glycosyltransferase family 2 protein [Pseudoroseicyclus tamaricis]NDV01339.1 glycosyltransferase [Pseudoroseicyclus tamaricis]